MATDKRELVLSRIKAVLETLGAPTVTRNRGELDATQVEFPALIVLDGDEQTASLFDSMRDILRPQRQPQIELVMLKPEIYIELKPRLPHNETIGQELNQWRATVVHALMTDTTLRDMLGGNGNVAYLGCETDLGRTKALKGYMRINMAFMYVLRANDLA